MKIWWLKCGVLASGYCFWVYLDIFLIAVLSSMYKCVWKCVPCKIPILPVLYVELL
jgi:hypothetical protein